MRVLHCRTTAKKEQDEEDIGIPTNDMQAQPVVPEEYQEGNANGFESHAGQKEGNESSQGHAPRLVFNIEDDWEGCG